MEWEPVKDTLLLYSLSLPRLLACFTVLPLLSKKTLGGTLIRNGIVGSLALFLYPIVAAEPFLQTASALLILAVIIKEIFLGMLIGFFAAIPFWIVEAAGFFIDNQRGATMASSINPALDSQSSPIGILLTQTLITLFLVNGSFLVFLRALYSSYISWPVTTFFPGIKATAVDFFFAQMAMLLKLCIVLSAPVIIVMFMAEFGLALISRFSPQLNVFFLAMPIKSVVGIFILIIYLATLMELLSDQTWHLPLTFIQLSKLF